MKQLLTILGMSTMFISAYGQSANTTLSNLASPTAVNQHLLPNSTGARDLGSSAKGWRDIYLTGKYVVNNRLFLHNKGTGNTFLGDSAGRAITSNGTYNTAIGYRALFADTSGANNTALGAFALNKTSNGYSNTAVGSAALQLNTTGYYNTAVGTAALQFNTTGKQNTAFGVSALVSNTTGNDNTALGYQALSSNTAGFRNTAIGPGTLKFTTTGQTNIAIGYQALASNTTGSLNVAIGYNALYSNTTSRSNIAIGMKALNANTVGEGNTAVGEYAAQYNIYGDYNTYIGYQAGSSQNDYSTFLGGFTKAPNNLMYITVIGYATEATAANQVRIGPSWTTSIGGQVGWTTLSDGRFKKNINEDVPGLAFINQLRPVTYNLDVDGYENAIAANAGQSKRLTSSDEIEARKAKSKMVFSGFIAQEVEATAQKMHYNFSGVDAPKNDKDFYGLRYAEFVVPLVKAVQEQQKQIEKQQQENIELKARIERLEKLIMSNSNIITSTSSYLEQNSPNPASNSTSIRYDVSTNAVTAKLDLTNAKGQIVRTISIDRGVGQLSLNTQSLASGNYNYTLYVDGKQVDTKRLVVAR